MSRLTLEVIVCSVEDAVEAARGGAGRLEVVRNLSRGGLTPSIELVQRIRGEVSLPLRVMVRESDGYACDSDAERRAVIDSAQAFGALGVDGIVVGWIADGRVDEKTLASVLDAAPSVRATFHRAFDELPDPRAAFDALRQYPQIDRVLTSAGGGEWTARCSTLRHYVQWAGPAIGILPGGGIDDGALRALAACDGITEAHVGGAARTGHAIDGPVSADAVRRLVRAT